MAAASGGRLIQKTGYFQHIPPIYADLGQLVAGHKPGRETLTERTVAANLRLAMDDMAVAQTLMAQHWE